MITALFLLFMAQAAPEPNLIPITLPPGTTEFVAKTKPLVTDDRLIIAFDGTTCTNPAISISVNLFMSTDNGKTFAATPFAGWSYRCKPNAPPILKADWPFPPAPSRTFKAVITVVGGTFVTAVDAKSYTK